MDNDALEGEGETVVREFDIEVDEVDELVDLEPDQDAEEQYQETESGHKG